MKKINVFLDMDGTILYFPAKDGEQGSKKYRLQEGYFLTLKAYKGLESINELAKNENYNVYILTNSPSRKADADKIQWVKNNLPDFKEENIICNRGGRYAKTKAEVAKKILDRELTKYDFLVDDYSENLTDWEVQGGTPIKRKNGTNCKKQVHSPRFKKLCRLTSIKKVLQVA